MFCSWFDLISFCSTRILQCTCLIVSHVCVIFSGVNEEGKGVKIESSAPVAEEVVTPPVTDAKVLA